MGCWLQGLRYLKIKVSGVLSLKCQRATHVMCKGPKIVKRLKRTLPRILNVDLKVGYF